MWVEFNGQPCYSTSKAPYINLLESDAVPEEFMDGLDFAVACDKDVELAVKSLTITEYENDEPETENAPELSVFEWYIKSLPLALRDEMIKIDEYFTKDIKPVLKFKKSIDKYGNLTYLSPCGFQIVMQKFIDAENRVETQHGARQIEAGWVRHQSKGYENMPNGMNEIFIKLAESSPEFADQMFCNLRICQNTACDRNFTVEYKGKTAHTCSSSIKFDWLPSEFEAIKKVVAAANEVVKVSNENK